MSNLQEWQEEHQPFELNYHSKDNYRWHDDQFLPAWAENFGGCMGLSPEHFSPDEILLDVGCGSRPAFSYFTRGRVCNIDPLLMKYLDIPQTRKHWTPKLINGAYDCAAEVFISDLGAACSLVNCWNVLDHCYNWRQVAKNLISYARRGGLILLCTDLESHGKGHPGIDNPAELVQMFYDNCKVEKLIVNYGKTVKRDLTIKAVKK